MKYLVSLIILSGVLFFSTSASAQPVEYVRVCDTYGAGYFYIPGTDKCIRVDDGTVRYETATGTVQEESSLAARVSDLEARISDAFGNGPSFNDVAISNALQAPDLISGEKVGFRINWGTAGNENAIGISGAVVFTESVFGNNGRLAGTGSVAFSDGQTGGNLGLQISW